MKLSILFCVLLAFKVSEGFVVQPKVSNAALKGMQSMQYRFSSSLLMSETDEKAESRQSLIQEALNSNSGDEMNEKSTMESETQYPIDIPSPILLATSMLLAISSVGKLMIAVAS